MAPHTPIDKKKGRDKRGQFLRLSERQHRQSDFAVSVQLRVTEGT
jgi:hypothetical protein